MPSVGASAETFPGLFEEQVRRYGDRRVAHREKDYGIWQAYTWREVWRRAIELANGLAALGLQRGERVCVVGDNRPELYWSMLATQMLGAVPVPLYQDAIEREMSFVVEHAEARFAVVEDQEQTDKLIEVKARCPSLEAIIYKDPRGLRGYSQPYLLSIAQLAELGRRWGAEHPGHVAGAMASVGPEDLAVICYTSGTTGRPKGVMLTHRNFAQTSREILKLEGLHEEEVLAYLPMAWVGDFFLSYAMAIAGGFTVNCPENSATVMEDLKEIGPTYFFAPPRIWENLLTSVMIRMDDAARIKRWVFHAFIGLAERLYEIRRQGRRPGPGQRLAEGLGRLLVYGPLLDNLGLRRVRIAYTAGEAIGPEIFTFFRSLGVNLKQLYGMTESSVFIAVQRNGAVRPDTCGPPVPFADVRLSEEGEVLVRGPGLFAGYFRDPDKTEEAFLDGYFRTGDAGFVDHEGHLKIIDRVKDVSRLADGTLFSPKYIENKLKFSPFIREAVAIGQERPYVTALVNIDAQAAGNWAERRQLAFSGYTDLAQKPEIMELVNREVERVNQSLSTDTELKGAQIRKFLILHKELDPDDEEITRTRKVRRRFIGEKYKPLIDSLYSDQDHAQTEVQVTYEDGRTATMKARLAIREMAVIS